MQFNEKTLNKNYIFKGKILNVRKDDVLLPKRTFFQENYTIFFSWLRGNIVYNIYKKILHKKERDWAKSNPFL